jgi:TolB protein
MSDEWIEGRALRIRTIRPPEPPPAVRSDARFLTPTGELKPLTDETIQEIEALLDARARGEAPDTYTPELQTSGGDRQRITQEVLDDLLVLARQRQRDTSPMDRPPSFETSADLPPLPHEHTEQPAPEEFVPWFATPTGELPPILADEELPPGDLVNAEWVEDVPPDAGLRTDTHSALRPPGPVTRQLLEAVREGRLTGAFIAPVFMKRYSRAAIAALLATAALAALILFAPGGLPGMDERRAAPTPTIDWFGTQAALPPPITDTPVPPTLTPTPTPLPYAVGRVAFASNRDGDFDIYVLDMVSGAVTRLTDSSASDRAPAWSPDGAQIVFISNREGDDDLYVMDADGANPVRLTMSAARDHSPAWSPDGSLIAFSRETVDGSSLLALPATCLGSPDACEELLAPITTDRYDRDPAWSPDGAQIAFAAASAPGAGSVIGLYAPASGAYVELPGTGSVDLNPAWSPDGAQIAFVSNHYGDDDLWLMDADGEGLVQLTRVEAGDVQPRWSPDGAYLLFASDRAGAGFDLWLVEVSCLARSDRRCDDAAIRLMDDPGDDLDPAWGP